ncbi:hypothetical protein JXJ21_08245 [candidate division KSB1 bacterium]|nr:hypothetical protein [candidate division KSB1 bacterium]
MRTLSVCILLVSIFTLITCDRGIDKPTTVQPTPDSGKKFVLPSSDLPPSAHHIQHVDYFGKSISGINHFILKAIDSVQAHAPDGGGYFIGITGTPPESPVRYNLHLFDQALIEIPRQSSYCSGATYTAFIEALNMMLGGESNRLSAARFEALRMQEPDGSRREDHVKFWGHWNADGYGNHYALVQYSKMGAVKPPPEALPGDFVNISWKSGGGHSVIFLAWTEIDGDPKIVYWSSQKATNGYGDQIVSLSRIKVLKVVRLMNLENLFRFNPNEAVESEVTGDSI